MEIFYLFYCLLPFLVYNINGIEACPLNCRCLTLGVTTCKRRLITEDMLDDIPISTEQLHLSNCNITFPFTPKTFARLTHMKYLYLNNEDEKGFPLRNVIPDLPDSVFAHMRNLQLLTLSNSSLRILTKRSFEGLLTVNKLFLDSNSLEVIPDGTFEGLHNLKELYLQNNKLKALKKETFVGLKNMNELDLSKNNIDSISGLNEMQNLKKLNLSYNSLYDISPSMFSGLTNLHELILSNNQLEVIEKGSLAGLNRLTTLEILDNPDLQCNCDLLGIVWNRINNGKHAEISCTANVHNASDAYIITTKYNKQLSDQDITQSNCRKTSAWSSWVEDDGCINYQKTLRRHCVGNFTNPKCSGSGIARKPCLPISYANYSLAFGKISFYNPHRLGIPITATDLGVGHHSNEKEFESKLSLSLRYFLYDKEKFHVYEVKILDLKIAPKSPPMDVEYQINMERTKKHIWQQNPIDMQRTIEFWNFKVDTKPEFSSIEDYDECEINKPCDPKAECIVVQENFNFGCQCPEEMKGNGFHCHMKEVETNEEPTPVHQVNIAVVITLVVGTWLIIIVIVVAIRIKNSKNKKINSPYSEENDNSSVSKERETEQIDQQEESHHQHEKRQQPYQQQQHRPNTAHQQRPMTASKRPKTARQQHQEKRNKFKRKRSSRLHEMHHLSNYSGNDYAVEDNEVQMEFTV